MMQRAAAHVNRPQSTLFVCSGYWWISLVVQWISLKLGSFFVGRSLLVEVDYHQCISQVNLGGYDIV